MEVNMNTPITMLTVRQFVEILKETPEARELLKEIVMSVLTDEDVNKVIDDKYNDKSMTVKGLQGIASIFGCSLVTAQKLKKTVIKDAVSQRGKLIITNVRMAKELFRKYRDEHGSFANLPDPAEKKK